MDCVEYEGALSPLGYGIAHRYRDRANAYNARKRAA